MAIRPQSTSTPSPSKPPGPTHPRGPIPTSNTSTTVTIYDVAYRSGVSIATVSRALNQKGKVQPETLRKIELAVQELGYRLHPLARGLVTKRTGLIEVCFSWSGYRINLENPWYVGLLDGINKAVQERQCGLVINTLSGIFDPKEVYHRILHNAVDGVLMVSPYLTQEGIISMKGLSVPIVFVGCRVEDPSVDYVDSDNVKSALQVVEHLAGSGHRRIACITGEGELSRDSLDRLEGFRKGMRKHRLPVPGTYVAKGDFGRESGFKAMEGFLSLPERPTAVFAFNDLMALGAWDAAEKAGLKVGRDLALVGFDDIPQASRAPYSLTTVRQDHTAISVRAAELLFERIQGGTVPPFRHILLPTELIPRRSSGSPP